MNKDNTDNCPACGVPYTEHLGLEGTCRQLQEEKKTNFRACQDWAEDDTAVREIAKTFGLDVNGDTWFVPSWLDLVDQIAGIARDTEAENQRLRAALEQAKEKMDHARYIVTNCHPTNLLPTLQTEWIDTALSPSAPAEQEEVYGEPYLTCLCINCGGTGERNTPCPDCGKKLYQPVRRQDMLGEWRDFVPSEENPVKFGDEHKFVDEPQWVRADLTIGWRRSDDPRRRWRRFHPATTNQEEGQ